MKAKFAALLGQLTAGFRSSRTSRKVPPRPGCVGRFWLP